MNERSHPIKLQLQLRVLLAFLFLFISGCDTGRGPSGLALVKMTIGNETFTLEVADTLFSKQRGLMNRDSLPSDRGMIFVFADDDAREFWMLNTPIALDILFVNSAGQVVSIHAMQPNSTTRTQSGGPAKWAIELNQGAALRTGVKVGDILKIPPQAGGPKDAK